MKGKTKLIGEALKEVRKDKGMSREQVAIYAGLAERTIQNIELGQNMSSRSLSLYMEALGVHQAKFYAQ